MTPAAFHCLIEGVQLTDTVPDVENEIATCKERQEEIDGESIGLGSKGVMDDDPRQKAIAQEYRSLEMLLTILRNYKRATAQPELAAKSVFLFAVDNGWVEAAGHLLQRDGGTAELHSVASLRPGLGARIARALMARAKELGAGKVTFTRLRYDNGKRPGAYMNVAGDHLTDHEYRLH